MMTEFWADLGRFISEHYEMGLTIGLIFLMIAVVIQFAVNSSLEEEICELKDRVEALEKHMRIKEE